MFGRGAVVCEVEVFDHACHMNNLLVNSNKTQPSNTPTTTTLLDPHKHPNTGVTPFARAFHNHPYTAPYHRQCLNFPTSRSKATV
jgi:hypothetical protein